MTGGTFVDLVLIFGAAGCLLTAAGLGLIVWRRTRAHRKGLSAAEVRRRLEAKHKAAAGDASERDKIIAESLPPSLFP